MTSPFTNNQTVDELRIKEQISTARSGGMDLGLRKRGATKLGSVDVPDQFRERFSVGYAAMDQFLSDGGGLCPIQSITITAPRGGGKTTLWLQLIQGMYSASNGDMEGLYGSGEEFVEQLALAAERIGAFDVCADNLTLIEDYLDEIKSGKWKIMVVDSLPSLNTNMRLLEGQLVRKSEVEEWEWKKTSPVPKTQIEEMGLQALVRAGKEHCCTTVFILHATKEGKTKGNSSLEHIVDTCINIVVPTDNEIEKGLVPYGAKLITISKNRFGAGGTVAFKMGRRGWDLDNPMDLAGTKAPENQKSTPGGARAEKKVNEMNSILDYMETRRGEKMTAHEILSSIDMPSDGTAWERFERHLKALTKMGKILRFGGGTGVKKPAVYEISPKK